MPHDNQRQSAAGICAVGAIGPGGADSEVPSARYLGSPPSAPGAWQKYRSYTQEQVGAVFMEGQDFGRLQGARKTFRQHTGTESSRSALAHPPIENQLHHVWGIQIEGQTRSAGTAWPGLASVNALLLYSAWARL